MGGPSLIQMASDEMPTAEEAKLLSDMAAARMSCSQPLAEHLATISPAAAAAYAEVRAAQMQVAYRAVKREISWGQFNRAWGAVTAQGTQKLSAAIRTRQAELQALDTRQAAEQREAVNGVLTALAIAGVVVLAAAGGAAAVRDSYVAPRPATAVNPPVTCLSNPQGTYVRCN